MAADKQHDDARQLLKVIRDRIERGEGPIEGYLAAAESIGQTGGRHMGQVCSRIDAAAFVTGWPMLSIHMIRKPNGDVNHESFSTHGWELWHDEVVGETVTHRWTVKQVDDIIRGLDGLPRDSAQLIWQGYMERGKEFIRWNLHRKSSQNGDCGLIDSR